MFGYVLCWSCGPMSAWPRPGRAMSGMEPELDAAAALIAAAQQRRCG
jgi:hypothetical protein